MAPKRTLLRLAVASGADQSAPLACLDLLARMPGRGAYLCADGDGTGARPECLSEAIRRGAIQRALRARAMLDPKLVESVGR